MLSPFPGSVAAIFSTSWGAIYTELDELVTRPFIDTTVSIDNVSLYTNVQRKTYYSLTEISVVGYIVLWFATEISVGGSQVVKPATYNPRHILELK